MHLNHNIDQSIFFNALGLKSFHVIFFYFFYVFILFQAGFVPNVFKTLSHRPEEMRAFVNYYDVVMSGRENGRLLNYF